MSYLGCGRAQGERGAELEIGTATCSVPGSGPTSTFLFPPTNHRLGSPTTLHSPTRSFANGVLLAEHEPAQSPPGRSQAGAPAPAGLDHLSQPSADRVNLGHIALLQPASALALVEPGASGFPQAQGVACQPLIARPGHDSAVVWEQLKERRRGRGLGGAQQHTKLAPNLARHD